MKRRRSQRGEVMLEFALIAPAVFLLAFGAMDLSRVYRTAMTVAGASRAGLQYASSSVVAMDDVPGITDAAKADGGSSPDLNVSVNHYCTCATGGEEVACTTTCTTRARYVRVTAKMPYGSILKIPGLASSFNLTSVSHMRIE